MAKNTRSTNRPPIRIPKELRPLTIAKLYSFARSHRSDSIFESPLIFNPQRNDLFSMKDDPHKIFPFYIYARVAEYAAYGGKPSKPFVFTRDDLLEIKDAIDYAELPLGGENYRECLLGVSRQMLWLYKEINQAANSPKVHPIMILGETGTGKELVARAIWRKSCGSSKKKPFQPLNCAAISEYLIESELFGHKKGAFTGAIANKKGVLEVAGEGVAFLDEIGEIPIHLQAKLLRVVNEREFVRVGDTEPKKLKARIIVASNRQLDDPSERSEPNQKYHQVFRQDLYYRLASSVLKVPPLRERIVDIPLLIHYFSTHPDVIGQGTKEFDLGLQALLFCLLYDWDGNVRELKNLIHRVRSASERDYLKGASDKGFSLLLKDLGSAGESLLTWISDNLAKDADDSYEIDWASVQIKGDEYRAYDEVTKAFPAIQEQSLQMRDRDFYFKVKELDLNALGSHTEDCRKALLREWMEFRYSHPHLLDSYPRRHVLFVPEEIKKFYKSEAEFDQIEDYFLQEGRTDPNPDPDFVNRYDKLLMSWESPRHSHLRYDLWTYCQKIKKVTGKNPWSLLASRINRSKDQTDADRLNHTENYKQLINEIPINRDEALKWFKEIYWERIKEKGMRENLSQTEVSRLTGASRGEVRERTGIGRRKKEK